MLGTLCSVLLLCTFFPSLYKYEQTTLDSKRRKIKLYRKLCIYTYVYLFINTMHCHFNTEGQKIILMNDLVCSKKLQTFRLRKQDLIKLW